MRSTARYSGWIGPATTTLWRPVSTTAITAASAIAVAASYIEALATSMAVSSAIIDWNSKMVCSQPWLASAW